MGTSKIRGLGSEVLCNNVMHYLISITKIYAVLKNSISLMRNASVNFARTLAAIFVKDIVRR